MVRVFIDQASKFLLLGPDRSRKTLSYSVQSPSDRAPTGERQEIPAPLDGLIHRMLAKDPRLRPSAVEVDAVLAEVAGRGTGGPASPSSRLLPRHSVGREAERAELRAGFESAVVGRGTLLCVAGEPGIGKTTLVEDFLGELAAGGRTCWIARGRCSERLAGAEAYLPFLEALE